MEDWFKCQISPLVKYRQNRTHDWQIRSQMRYPLRQYCPASHVAIGWSLIPLKVYNLYNEVHLCINKTRTVHYDIETIVENTLYKMRFVNLRIMLFALNKNKDQLIFLCLHILEGFLIPLDVFDNTHSKLWKTFFCTERALLHVSVFNNMLAWRQFSRQHFFIIC